MQNALPVLHNALRLSSLRNANQLKLMESSQVDGNLPQAWPWNICDSSNVIDVANVKDTKRDRYSQVGGARSKEEGHERVIWVWTLPCRIQHQQLLAFSPTVIKQGMKDVVYHTCYVYTLLDELKDAILHIYLSTAWLWKPPNCECSFECVLEYCYPCSDVADKKQFGRTNRKWYRAIMPQLKQRVYF